MTPVSAFLYTEAYDGLVKYDDDGDDDELFLRNG